MNGNARTPITPTAVGGAAGAVATVAMSAWMFLAQRLGAGVTYARRRRRLPRRFPPVLAGAIFGLAVWSANYQTWIPWIGIMPPPRHDRPCRPSSMIVAHLVFGPVLGALVERRAR